jgi:Flp pilus assembly protein CpaB
LVLHRPLACAQVGWTATSLMEAFMRGRVLIIIAFIIILAAVVVVAILPTLNTGGPVTSDTSGPSTGNVNTAQSFPTPTPLSLVEVVIAVQELPRGFRIPANAVALRAWPEESAPFNGITNLEDVIGKIARTRIFREQPILTSMVTDDFTSLAEVGSDAAAILPNGLLAISIPINRLTSVSYALQPGDRVDVILSMLFVDVDDTFQSIAPNLITLFQITEEGFTFTEAIEGRPDSTSLGPAIISPSERQRPRLVTQSTVKDALVLHVGEFPLDGVLFGGPPTPTPVPAEDTDSREGTPLPTSTPPLPTVVTLGVTPQEAVVLVWAIEAKLPITMGLRSASDNARATTQAVTLDFILANFNINPPGKRQFTIEPALRSIRQLLDEDEVSLTGN